MKITLTVEQLKRILASEPVHLPIIIRMNKITKKELEELSALLKSKEKST